MPARKLGEATDADLLDGSARAVAQRLGCDAQTVYAERWRRDLPSPSRSRRSKWKDEWNALLGTASDRSIAKQLGLCVASVAKRRLALGIGPFRTAMAWAGNAKRRTRWTPPEGDGTAPLRLQVRLRNNPLLTARERLGLTQEKMAAFLGVRFYTLRAYEGLRLRPEQGGEWTQEALRMAAVLEMEPEALFPQAARLVTRPCIDVPMSNEQIARMLDCGDTVPLLEAAPGIEAAEIRDALGTLEPRERDVVERLMAGEIRSDTARTLGRSPERARQIEAKALRKLRHPSRGLV